jgi:hypothetical protein
MFTNNEYPFSLFSLFHIQVGPVRLKQSRVRPLNPKLTSSRDYSLGKLSTLSLYFIKIFVSIHTIHYAKSLSFDLTILLVPPCPMFRSTPLPAPSLH